MRAARAERRQRYFVSQQRRRHVHRRLRESRHLEKTRHVWIRGAGSDFDNDGWPDIYVADDSAPSALWKNNHDGTFTDIGMEAGVAFGADGKTQAGMGVSAIDLYGNGNLDIVKTNFAGDTSSLYKNLGGGNFEDVTFQSGLGRNTRFLGWGACFFDFDNDGWPDI